MTRAQRPIGDVEMTGDHQRNVVIKTMLRKGLALDKWGGRMADGAFAAEKFCAKSVSVKYDHTRQHL